MIWFILVLIIFSTLLFMKATISEVNNIKKRIRKLEENKREDDEKC